MRTLVVDDEPFARSGVILRLKRFPGVEVIGECSDGFSAAGKILELSPDLVFLDVQMPGMNGFEVLRSLPIEKLPRVIFLTAFEEHALHAFEVHALDYLLKPVDEDRFAAAVDHAQLLINTASRVEAANRVLGFLDRQYPEYSSRFLVRTGTRIQVVAQDAVLWISAASDYAELHTEKGVHLVRETMSSLEQRLDPAQFIRVHRSRIVRLDQIVELVSHENGQYAIKLRDGSQHHCSRTYTQALEAWLHSQRGVPKPRALDRDRSIGTVNYRTQLTRALDRGESSRFRK